MHAHQVPTVQFDGSFEDDDLTAAQWFDRCKEEVGIFQSAYTVEIPAAAAAATPAEIASTAVGQSKPPAKRRRVDGEGGGRDGEGSGAGDPPAGEGAAPTGSTARNDSESSGTPGSTSMPAERHRRGSSSKGRSQIAATLEAISIALDICINSADAPITVTFRNGMGHIACKQAIIAAAGLDCAVDEGAVVFRFPDGTTQRITCTFDQLYQKARPWQLKRRAAARGAERGGGGGANAGAAKAPLAGEAAAGRGRDRVLVFDTDLEPVYRGLERAELRHLTPVKELEALIANTGNGSRRLDGTDLTFSRLTKNNQTSSELVKDASSGAGLVKCTPGPPARICAFRKDAGRMHRSHATARNGAT